VELQLHGARARGKRVTVTGHPDAIGVGRGEAEAEGALRVENAAVIIIMYAPMHHMFHVAAGATGCVGLRALDIGGWWTIADGWRKLRHTCFACVCY
jgi:hypothetical protein